MEVENDTSVVITSILITESLAMKNGEVEEGKEQVSS